MNRNVLGAQASAGRLGEVNRVMPILSLVFGAVVGLSLGLTGGGGAIFAVPLLVYGLSVEPRRAVGISLAAVGATSLAGFLGAGRPGRST